jgi:hypothetical protein
MCVWEREREISKDKSQSIRVQLIKFKQSNSVYFLYPETKTVSQCVCRLCKYKTTKACRVPKYKTIIVCVGCPNIKGVSRVYGLSKYKRVYQCVCVCVCVCVCLDVCVCVVGERVTLNLQYLLALHPPLSVWRFKSSGMLRLVDWKTLRFIRSCWRLRHCDSPKYR